MSGNDYHVTQVTENAKPLYKTNILNGLPGVLFDGSNDTLVGAATHAGNKFTLFIVAQRVSNGSSNYQAWISWHTNGANDYNSSTGLVPVYANNLLKSFKQETNLAGQTNHPSNGTPFKFTTLFNGTNNYAWYNGSSANTASASCTNTWDLEIFKLSGRGDATNRFINGYIFEVIAYDSDLSTEDRETVETYLTNKYFPE